MSSGLTGVRLKAEQYQGKVVEVKIGATKGEGGTRCKSIIIGGETTPAFYAFEGITPHSPVVAADVFDAEVALPGVVKAYVRDVIGDPIAWAKLAVDKFGADLITLHLISTSPLGKDASPKEAARTVEEVLQAVDVPIIVGGSGDPKKDVEVFEKAAEVAAGERVVISTITADMDVERCAKFIKEHGHVALTLTPVSLDMARTLHRRLYDFLKREDIVMDLTTAALGYGLEYTFTIMERARLAALMGDTDLQHPISCAASNTWAAKEAWRRMDPTWEPRDLRGPLWEVVTALTCLLAGADLFMMLHPMAAKTVKDVIDRLMKGKPGEVKKIVNWVSARI